MMMKMITALILISAIYAKNSPKGQKGPISKQGNQEYFACLEIYKSSVF